MALVIGFLGLLGNVKAAASVAVLPHKGERIAIGDPPY